MNESETVHAKNRKKFIFPVAAVVLVLVVVIAVSSRNDEPTYEGRKLSEWLDDVGTAFSTFGKPDPIYKTTEALSEIGTNAIPYLLEWIKYEDSDLRKSVAELLGRLDPKLKSLPLKQEGYYLRSEIGFSLLAEEALNTRPELQVLYNESEVVFTSGKVEFRNPQQNARLHRIITRMEKLESRTWIENIESVELFSQPLWNTWIE